MFPLRGGAGEGNIVRLQRKNQRGRPSHDARVYGTTPETWRARGSKEHPAAYKKESGEAKVGEEMEGVTGRESGGKGW